MTQTSDTPSVTPVPTTQPSVAKPLNVAYKAYVTTGLSILLAAAFEAVRTGGQGNASILYLRQDVTHLQAQVARIEAKLDADAHARTTGGPTFLSSRD